MKKIYTIGHSVHAIDEFVGLLKSHEIEFVVDVRSIPYKKNVPQFDREQVRDELKKYYMRYLYMGNVLGGLIKDPMFCDEEGIIDFRLINASKNFQNGIRRILEGCTSGFCIALMGAEMDPFMCHRFSIISRELVCLGLDVLHIMGNGALVSNRVLEEQLISKYRYEQMGLCESIKSYDQLLDEAYREHMKFIASVIPVKIV